MNLSIAGAILFAALLHAGWHSLVKSNRDGVVLLTGMCLVASLLAVWFLPFVSFPGPQVWPILAVSILLHSCYRFSLAQVYLNGDLSQAYPLARGLVPIFATVIAFIALGERPTSLQVVGIIVISIGLLLIGAERLPRSRKGRLILFGMLAGFTVSTYSVVDSYGVRLSGDWLGYTAWLIVCDCLGFLAIVYGVRGNTLWTELYRQRWHCLGAGLLGVFAFTVFLWALAGGAVGPITALRETSIVFSVLIGVILHRDVASPNRFVATAVILAGIAVTIWAH